MSAAARAMAAGLSSGARRFVVQLELTNKTKPTEQLAALGPQSSRLFFKNKLTRGGTLAPSTPTFLPFTWRCARQLWEPRRAHNTGAANGTA